MILVERLNDEKIIQALELAMNDESSTVRQTAAQTLGQMADVLQVKPCGILGKTISNSKKIIESLRKHYDLESKRSDSDPSVAKTIVASIQSIEGSLERLENKKLKRRKPGNIDDHS